VRVVIAFAALARRVARLIVWAVLAWVWPILWALAFGYAFALGAILSLAALAGLT
jgi:hypothetical protein